MSVGQAMDAPSTIDYADDMTTFASNPANFATVLPEAEARLAGVRARLADLSQRYDPDGLFR